MAVYLKPGPQISVEHFYHFMLQYLLPLFEMDLADGVVGKGYILRDCGPMNIWFDFAFGPDAFTIVSREEFRAARWWRFRDRNIQLDTFADNKGLSVDAIRFHEVVDAFREKFAPATSKPDMVTVLDRRPPPSFYLDGSTEAPSGGSRRRSISNLDELTRMISERVPAQLVDFAEMSPSDQMEVVSRSTVLVGQHGAGLLQSIFMRRDAALVEMNKREGVQQHFLNLSEDLGREYRAFYIGHKHATLSPQMLGEIADFIVSRAR